MSVQVDPAAELGELTKSEIEAVKALRAGKAADDQAAAARATHQSRFDALQKAPAAQWTAEDQGFISKVVSNSLAGRDPFADLPAPAQK